MTTACPLVDAVAASCAVPGVWPPVTIEGRRYIDGGVRSSANADLAEGYDEVLVIAPVRDFLVPEKPITRRLKKLEKSASLLTVQPDKASLAAMGPNPLDPAAAKPAAQAGRAQAADVVAAVREVWS